MGLNWKAVLALAFAFPLGAHAQTYEPAPAGMGMQTEEVTEWSARPSLRKPTVGVLGDIGVSNYNRDFGGVTDPGVGYGARVDLSPTRNVGLELAYNGAVNDLDSNISTDGRLVTNAVGGSLRLNLVPARRDLPGNIKPFVTGGAMYQRVDTDNFTPGIEDSNLFALPVGVGVEADLGKTFLIGARYQYNFLFNEIDNFGNRDADNWLASINLGARLGN